MTIAALQIDPTSPLVAELRDEFSPARLADFTGHGAGLLPDHVWESALCGPLVDFLSRPGKEFRGQLVSASWSIVGGSEPMPRELPLIVEVLHAGSLIVDDIQDGSATRRGQPALHRVYGLPTALNAGNWLYFWAFALASRAGLGPDRELLLARLLTTTLLRCHQGQALDLDVRMDHLARRDIPRVVETTTRLKTGCLVALATSIGALARGAGTAELTALSRFGNDVGTCLQMLDDTSGLYNERRCHKGHEDLLLGRPTWPWAWLAESLGDTEFSELQGVAREVESHDRHPEVLARRMQRLLGGRPKGTIRRALRKAFDELEIAVGRTPVIAELRALVARLERSYE